MSLLALAACGFSPVYGPSGPGASLRGQVAVVEPETRTGFVLTRALETRLGRPTEVRYRLSVDLRVDERPAAFTPDRQITRFTVTGQARWQLFDANGVLVGSGQEDSFTAYSATGTTADVLAGEEAARDRLGQILADRIVTQLWTALE